MLKRLEEANASSLGKRKPSLKKFAKAECQLSTLALYEPKRVVGDVLTLPAFVGRQDKQADMRVWWQKKTVLHRCWSGGAGKTALATRFMNEDSHFDSIVFVTLRGQGPTGV